MRHNRLFTARYPTTPPPSPSAHSMNCSSSWPAPVPLRCHPSRLCPGGGGAGKAAVPRAARPQARQPSTPAEERGHSSKRAEDAGLTSLSRTAFGPTMLSPKASVMRVDQPQKTKESSPPDGLDNQVTQASPSSRAPSLSKRATASRVLSAGLRPPFTRSPVRKPKHAISPAHSDGS